MPTISICIPTYEMKGLGTKFLRESFDILTQQTFKDFDIVISDHSKDDSIKNLCEEYSPILTIHYYRNDENRGSSSANINNAIRHATGGLIKILFQDDFLFHERALEEIVEHFDIQKDHWLLTGCTHSCDGVHFFNPLFPKVNSISSLWIKTVYSSPSTLTIKNTAPLLFDESLLWLMDSDYYRRYHDTFGEPKILKTINVVNRVGAHQITNSLATENIKRDEYVRVLKKHEHGINFWYYRIIGLMKNVLKSLFFWK
ncbi:MAG: glycosyltransferase family 2 protein [Minisyncoccia bacterium]